jgi:hypothetical protein
MTEFMKSDKKLEADINKAQTYEDLRALLENATSRSGIADRDPQTGQFVRRDPLTPATQTASPNEEEQEITKTEVIGGKEFIFTGTALEVEKAIGDAFKVANAVKTAEPVTPRSVRTKTQAEIERDISDRAELDLQFRRGELTTQELLERTNLVGDYLESKGFDVEQAASRQFEQSWAEATETFLHTSGSDWPGGIKNREILGMEINALGLVDAADKVAALTQGYASMKAKGIIFQGDVSPEQVIESTANATPQEILEAWKEKQGDPEVANQAFIQSFQGGRFFDR